ncbi:porin family protein [Tunicatimonas pelagia]|uniref:porin family protein n=1 Tax=Tunicatimonas pelagia TaxID=931531 RepID=UPI00266637B3|nr:porin family protein [Tunicatimonas pelagia]WKN46192.1 porin family protein [Tunicatimonas pelagia]
MTKLINQTRRKVRRMMLVLPLAVCFIASPVFAQDESSSTSSDGSSESGSSFSLPLEYGPKIGLTSSGFYQGFMTGREHTGSVTGVAIGGFATYSLLDFLDVSAELLYMQQGGTRVELKESIVDESSSNIAITGNVKLHNIEFPVLLRASLPNPVMGIRPQLIVGPSIGFNFAATQSQDITYFIEDGVISDDRTGRAQFSVTDSGSEDVRSEYRSMQYGLNIGLGAEIPTGSSTFLFDVRYRYGLNPINNGFDPNDLLRDATDLRSNSFIFSVGLTL